MKKTKEQCIAEIKALKERVKNNASPMWEAIQKCFSSKSDPYTREKFFEDLDWICEDPVSPNGQPLRGLSLYQGSTGQARWGYADVGFTGSIYVDGISATEVGHLETNFANEEKYRDLLYVIKAKPQSKKAAIRIFQNDFRDIKTLAEICRKEEQGA